MAIELPWYQDGLRFTCTQCGNCCSGAPGNVWVSNEEIQALAAAAGEDAARFEEVYVREVGARKSLRERANGDCVLLDAEKRTCTAYDARPRQCKTWPFWDSNLKTPVDWAHTCEVCPGSGRGKLYQLDQIEEQRKVIKV